MDDTYLMEVIRTTTRVGFDEEGTPVHQHIQFYTTDGELLAERCDGEYCVNDTNDDFRLDPIQYLTVDGDDEVSDEELERVREQMTKHQ